VLDFKTPADMQLLRAMLRRADVFIHNLAPGAVERAGLRLTELRERNPRLITCAISGYGENNDYADMRAYDNLIQGEGAFLPSQVIRADQQKWAFPFAISARVCTPTWNS